MNLYVKINSENVGYSNLKEMIENPCIFDFGIFDYIQVTYSELKECNSENIDILNYITEFEVNENNFHEVLEFVKESEYIAVTEILKDNIVEEYISNNADLLSDRFDIKASDIYFTDREFYLDKKLKKAYKLINNKLRYVGSVDDVLLKCELEWFDTIYISNVDTKKIIEKFNIDIRKVNKNNFIKDVEFRMEKELLDVSEINQNILFDVNDEDFNYYLSLFCTRDRFKEFLERNNKYIN